ncbi:MAG: hypothetical protein MJZ28_03420 [Paludibacteraceae bacterium]|nr:hypothetical protein [Paludibacteraceae bacterium]
MLIDPKSLIDTKKCKLIKKGKLTSLSIGLVYHIYETPEGEIWGETLCSQILLCKTRKEYEEMPLDKLESRIYRAEMNVAR